ncbi:MAG: hypothetical protein NVS1B7_7880 [Candidatus Saccharimonadales bacterium]
MHEYDFGQSIQNGLDKLFGILPVLIGVVLLVIVGWLIATIVKKLTIKLLKSLRFDHAVSTSPAGSFITRVVEHPTTFVAKSAYWIIFLSFVSFALSSLNIPALSLMIAGIYRYIPNVIAAIIIFLVASAVTAGAEAFVNRVLKFSPLAKVIGAIIPALTMSVAIFMILNQLHLAKDIVNITYSALMGSIALGLALAFGLGGRDVAARILGQAYENTVKNGEMMKSDLKQAGKNTRKEARSA